MPWYLSTPALLILKRLKANPPAIEGTGTTNPLMKNAEYRGYDVIALRSLFAKKAHGVLNANPYDAEAAKALLNDSADEVLAALFGCPHGFDRTMASTFAAEIARRDVIRGNIEAALAERLAA